MKHRWSICIALLLGCSSSAPSSSERGEPLGPPPERLEPPGAEPPAEPGREADAPLREAERGAAPSSVSVAHITSLGECTGPEGRTLRTLVIGNSNIYYWDLPKILTDMSRTAPPRCPRIEAEQFTRGGQNLHRLWTQGDSRGRDLATVIREGGWDVVVLSESIDLVDFPPPEGKYVEYATLIVEAVRAAGAVPILYASPYVDKRGRFGFVEMAQPQIELGRRLSVTVATAGLAWLRVWQELPEVFLHHTDHSHPGPKGSVVSSMVLYAAITRASPLPLSPPVIDCFGTPCPEIPADELEVFKRAAWDEARAVALR